MPNKPQPLLRSEPGSGVRRHRPGIRRRPGVAPLPAPDQQHHHSTQRHERYGQGRTAEITNKDDKLTVKQGDLSIEITNGKATVTAMQSIELTVGANSIRIDQTGITINGMLISVNGTGAISLDAPMTSVSGDATVSITGGLVEIN